MPRPKLMKDCEKRQILGNPKWAMERQLEYPLRMCQMLAEDMAQRTTESRQLFRWKFYRGDCHSHTQHSDGGGTVEDTAKMVQAAGLDFQFVTDHWGVTQAPECKKFGLWVGQEPPIQYHHLGILGLDHAFEPGGDFFADIAEVQKRGGVFFIPHPTGWWPTTVYKPEQLAVLEKLADPFLMEICNGANNIVSAFDYTDDSAVQLWDHLLLLGKTIHAMGNTDAHAPHGIGMVWNSVFASKCEQQAILKALCAGRSFVSDGPLVHMALGKAQMGQRVRAGERSAPLRVTAVDSRGLSWVRVIADGKELGWWSCWRKPKFEKSIKIPAKVKRYVRVEVGSDDGRRAFSNPVYLAGR